MAKHRVGTVGYLNTAPLCSRLDPDVVEVVADHPSVIARMLADDEVALGLVPVAAVLADGDYRVMGELCIGADGPVHSVVLAAELPPEQWEEVVLDGVSRTSVVLATLLLRRGPLAARVRPDLRVVNGPPGSGLTRAGGTTAGLVIGDAAMDLPDSLPVRIDLAEAWKAWTGLPFVFAVWAGRAGVSRELLDHVREAGRLGLASRSTDFRGPELAYLTHNIRYTLDDRAMVGLRRFAALARQEGLVGSDLIRFYGPASPRRARPAGVERMLERGADGERLSVDEAVALEGASLADLTAAADLRRRDLHPSGAVTWRLGRVLDADPDSAWLEQSRGVEVTEVALVGGGLTAVQGRARALSDAGLRPHVTWFELERLAAEVHLGPELVVQRLVAAGVAEVELSATARDLARLVDAAGDASITVVAQLREGGTPPERVEALRRVREVHDRTGAIDAFRIGVAGRSALGTTAADFARASAIARLFVDNVASLAGAWSEHGEELTQASLHLGCDDLGVVWLEGDDPAAWEPVRLRVALVLQDAGRDDLRVRGRRRRPVRLGVDART